MLANTQGELSPLERGIHFNGSGRGVREYAREVGRDHKSVHFESQAAEVCTQVHGDASALLDKTRHLAAIHALPAACWPEAVAAMLSGGWSKDETAKRVAEAKSGSMVSPVVEGPGWRRSRGTDPGRGRGAGSARRRPSPGMVWIDARIASPALA